MKKATICFLIKGDEVIIATKKRKVGAGFLNGYGGKPKEGETLRQCAQRETFEECGVLIDLAKTNLVAVIAFYAGDTPMFSCAIYIARDWSGDPVESEEMGAPEIFRIDSLPYDRMLPGDRLWFERIMGGETFTGELRYNADFSEVLSFNTTPRVFEIVD